MNRDELLEALSKIIEAAQTIVAALIEEDETRKAMGDVESSAPPACAPHADRGTEKSTR